MYRSATGFSDDQEFTKLETVSSILRLSHLRRGNVTSAVLHDESNTSNLTGDMHLWVRVLSYLDADEIIKSFRVSKRWLVYQYNNVLWKLVYVCQSPLKYSARLQEVGHMLVSPLDGSGFDVHELEERERYYDLHVVLSVCGFYRVLSQAERMQEWPVSITDSTAGFAYTCGTEIASTIRGVYGSFLEALPTVWPRLFCSPVPEPTMAADNTYTLTSPLCTEKGCQEVHYRPPLLAALLTGVNNQMGLGNAFTVTANGCVITVMWAEVPQQPTHCEQYTMRPNVMFYKSSNLLDKLIEGDGAGTRLLSVCVGKMLSGTQSGLRKTPAEKRRVVCRHCREEVSSFDYASQHSQSRCLRSHTESSSLARTSSYGSSSMLSTHSTPKTPYMPLPQGGSQRSPVGSAIEPGTKFSPPLTPSSRTSGFGSSTQTELENQLKERRMQFFSSLLSSIS